MIYASLNPTNCLLLKIGISHDAPPVRVKEVLLRCAQGVPGVAASPAPLAFVQDYAESSILYGLSYGINDLGKRLEIQDEMATRVWYALRREKIEIP